MGGLCGDGNGVQLEGSRERIWLPPRESRAGLGAGFTRAWPTLTKRCLRRSAPEKGGLTEWGAARCIAGSRWRSKERRAWRLRSVFGEDPRCRTDLFR
ncbi:hypothetical protein M0R45_025915 [Rubus argutus]|uniref:Uncharacterized protein n=1 Tax=Rubus argutus TaxID=59490 RepID=A0AAW1WXL2_RUBAR